MEQSHEPRSLRPEVAETRGVITKPGFGQYVFELNSQTSLSLQYEPADT